MWQSPLRQVVSSSGEYQLALAVAGSAFYSFRVLVVEAASAPTSWGRFAAWLGRSKACVADPAKLWLAVYVDDP
eukprot:8981193-Alexandrium_andersonii.AAC.1